MKGLKNKILIFLSAILGVVLLVSCNTPTQDSTPTITNPVTPTEPTQTEVETEYVIYLYANINGNKKKLDKQTATTVNSGT